MHTGNTVSYVGKLVYWTGERTGIARGERRTPKSASGPHYPTRQA